MEIIEIIPTSSFWSSHPNEGSILSKRGTLGKMTLPKTNSKFAPEKRPSPKRSGSYSKHKKTGLQICLALEKPLMRTRSQAKMVLYWWLRSKFMSVPLLIGFQHLRNIYIYIYIFASILSPTSTSASRQGFHSPFTLGWHCFQVKGGMNETEWHENMRSIYLQGNLSRIHGTSIQINRN